VERRQEICRRHRRQQVGRQVASVARRPLRKEAGRLRPAMVAVTVSQRRRHHHQEEARRGAVEVAAAAAAMALPMVQVAVARRRHHRQEEARRGAVEVAAAAAAMALPMVPVAVAVPRLGRRLIVEANQAAQGSLLLLRQGLLRQRTRAIAM
jgi:hypothetical protein